MNIYAIGDVHGCIDELNLLLKQIDAEIQPDDIIVMLGDYVDRGPDSYGVVERLIALKSTMGDRLICLKGNHEDMMFNDKNTWLFNGARQTEKSYEDVGKPISVHKDFYDSLETYYSYGRYVFVHAGLDPTLSLDNQADQDMLWSRRSVGYDGDYVDNMFVVYGHTPTQNVIVRRNQLGIDTACVFGGKLTAAKINPKTEQVTFIQIACDTTSNH